MDNELLMSLLPTWQSLSSAIDLHAPELSSCPYGADQSLGCFFTPYWDKSTESSDGLVFDSGISSLASSPVSQPNTPTDGFLMRELIAMLGEFPPPTHNSGHPFKEHAPRWGHSTSPVNLGARSFNGRTGQYPELATMEMRMMSRVSSSPSLQPVGSLFGAPQGSTSPNPASQDRAELSNSLSEANWGKRKAAARRKEAEVEDDSGSGTKRAKQSDGGNGNENGSVKAEEEEEKGGSDESAEIADVKDEKLQVNINETKPPEPPRDYIHVRARRGQATDSHSLAERVRREKISERMKILQDLVPGCSKVVLEKYLKLEETLVTGKALMLDEIINYVQSLQRQVEFLSMKLASVDSGIGLDSNTNTPTVKDVFEPDSNGRNRMLRLDSSAPALYGQRNQAANISDRAILQCPVDPLNNTQFLPYQAFLGGDLHSIIQMGYGQN